MPAYVNPHTSFFDKSFTESLYPSYILSVQLSLHGLAFSVYHPEKNKIIALESFRFVGVKNKNQPGVEIDSVIDQRKWLKQSFKQINIIYTDQNCTLIPSSLFVEKEKESLLKFNQPINEDASVLYNQLKNAGAINIFTIAEGLKNKLLEVWPGACDQTFLINPY